MQKILISFSTILFLVFSFAQTRAQAQADSDTVVIDKIMAVVGDQIVKLSDIENQYLQMKAQGYVSSGDGKCEVFEDLLFQKLLVNQAKIDSVQVSEAEVEADLDRRLSGFIQQAGGEAELERHFGKPLIEIKAEFRSVIREQLLAQRMQMEITDGVKATPAEIIEYFEAIPKDSLPVVKAELQIAQIVKRPKVSAEQQKAALEKVKELRKRIAEGEDFATLAILYSEDPGSSSKGGELGYMPRSAFVPEFAAVAFSLKPGELSQVVTTDFGYHIIRMIDRKENQVNVRHILIKPRITTQAKIKAQSKLDSIATVIRTDTLTFEQAAALYSDDENTKKNGGLLINPYTGTSRFELRQVEPTIKYITKQLKVGEISDPFPAKDDAGRDVFKIITIKKRSEEHQASLKTDYEKIQEMALNHKKNEILNEWIRSKQESTYIKIDPSYQNCQFRLKGWVK